MLASGIASGETMEPSDEPLVIAASFPPDFFSVDQHVFRRINSQFDECVRAVTKHFDHDQPSIAKITYDPLLRLPFKH